jgi:DNA-binding beta-propeller fold protein YncE
MASKRCFLVLLCAAFSIGCNDGSALSCGAGTQAQDGQCVPANSDSGIPINCGTGTHQVGSECLPDVRDLGFADLSHADMSNADQGSSDMDVFMSDLASDLATSDMALLPSKLAFVVMPNRAPPGATILPSVQVAAEDASGNVIASTASITIAINTGAGTLSGTLTRNAVNGIAGFDDLSIDTAGSFTLIATSGSATPAISAPLTIGPISATDGLGHLDDVSFNFSRGTANDDLSSSGFSFPDGLALDLGGHRLFVADGNTGRVLVFNLTATNHIGAHFASFVIGQPSFVSQVGLGSPRQSGVAPTGIAFDPLHNLLYVADEVYNRVMVFDTSAISNGMNAVHVLGQTSFNTFDIGLSQSGMYRPSGVAVDGANNRLYVDDSGNGRILVFDTSAGISDGMNAAFVIGQTDFTSATVEVSQTGLGGATGNPAVDISGQRLFVPDTRANRLLVYSLPITTNAPAAIHVIGQTDFTTGTHRFPSTQSTVTPSDVSYDGSQFLFVVDQNRVLQFDVSIVQDGISAYSLVGQPDFFAQQNAGSAADQLALPSAVAVEGPHQILYVADSLNNRVLEYNLKTNVAVQGAAADGLGHCDSGVMKYFGRTSANDDPNDHSFSSPGGVALDRVGHRLYVADAGNSRVLVFPLSATNDLSGVQKDAANILPLNIGGSPGSPRDVAFDSAREVLYVADTVHNRVVAFNTSGGIASAGAVLGQADLSSSTAATTQNGMNGPSGLAVDADGTLYVSDGNNNRVLVFRSVATGRNADFVLGQASFTTQLATTTKNGMSGPAGALGLDPSRQRLYVADSNDNRVLVFDTSMLANGMNASVVLGQSNFTSSLAAATRSGMSAPAGVAVDPVTGRIYVSDSGSARVLIFAANSLANGMNAASQIGQSSFTAAGAGTSPTSLFAPAGLAYDSANGRLYLADKSNHRAVLFNFP